MTAKELAQSIRELHHLVPKLLVGEMTPEEFWSRVEAWFEQVSAESSALAAYLPGEGTIQQALAALREGIRWDLELNRTLFPVLQGRESEDILIHHAVSIFGIMSAEILDRLFSRLAVWAELLGILDGSIEFPEETYLTYRELRAMIQAHPFAEYSFDVEDLDA